tara:strand:+ start:3349 stop:3567 length:219 start_codon:yes stop_codon:yes gene_type:complete
MSKSNLSKLDLEIFYTETLEQTLYGGVYSYTLDRVTIWEVELDIDLDTKFNWLKPLIENVEELVLEKLETLG